VQQDGHAGLRKLPSSLASSEPAPDHMDFVAHGENLARKALAFKPD
jgi:hypothetical protein